MTIARIQELEKLIIYHKEAYYLGRAQISDEDYDRLERELRQLDPKNPVLSLVGTDSGNVEGKVRHVKRMLSLDKTYDLTDLERWIGSEAVVSVLKIDGSSCSLLYEGGRLVMAKTRGDGQFGENITQKVLYITDVPKTIPFQENLEVRGEIFCLEENFIELSKAMETLGLEKPTSQRNIVAGILGRKENVHLAVHLSFKAFDLLGEKKIQRESEKMRELGSLGFDLPDHELHRSTNGLSKRIEEAREFMTKGSFLIDGLVFVYEDLKLHDELGETSHHPRYKLAYKFQGETKITQIEKIEWGVSRNGVLTPVAHVTPVELSGASIARVTLHNFGLAQTFKLRPGDHIEIIRSGEVIPKFLRVVEKSEGDFEAPIFCPSCSSKLETEGIWLLCINDRCPAKVKEEILNYIQKSGIEDLSDRRLEELMARGLVTSVADLYRISVSDLLQLDKVKVKLAEKVFSKIQKTKSQTLVQFVSAIGVEGVSTAKTERIISHGYNSLDKFLSLSLEQLLAIEGFAEKSSQLLLDSLDRKRPLVHDLLSLGVEVQSDNASFGDGPLSGMKFCITGELSAPRAEIEKSIKARGGVVVGSVSKNTNYLVTNELDGTSGKFLKAKATGVPLLTEEALKALLKDT